MISNQKRLERAMFREASRRTECPELRRDMIQQAWLDILEKRSKGTPETEELGLVIKGSVIPAMSKYFWSNRCVVSCSRPRKNKMSVPVNVSDDVLLRPQSDIETEILIDPSKMEDLQRRHYCEFEIANEAKAILEGKEYAIIRNRFLEDKKTTRKAIGQDIGVSAERVRQIENIALGKLKEKISYQN